MAAERRDNRDIALGGILAALAVAILWLGSMLPGYAIPTAAVAGLVSAVAVLKRGLGLSAAVFAVSAFLGMILLPQKFPAIWYLLLFGHYPILKSLAERLPKRVLEWGMKASVYAVAFVAVRFLFRDVFMGLQDFWLLPDAAWFAIGMVVFFLYDIGCSRLIGLYLRRFCRNSGKGV